MNAHRAEPEEKNTLARAGIAVFGAVFVFSVIASAFRWYPAVTLPAAAVSFAAAAGCADRARLRGGRQ